MRDSARSGKVSYVTSGWTIEELAGLAEHDERKHRTVVTFALDLVGDKVIEDPPTLGETELRLGRPLKGWERMIVRENLGRYRRIALDLETAKFVAEETARQKREDRAKLIATRDEIWARLADLAKDDPRAKGDPRAATLLWFKELERWMPSWSRKSLAHVLKSVGRDPAEADTYPLDRVPSVVNTTAAMLARLAWNAGYSRRIDEGDTLDTRHYVAACYTDVFVTSDQRLIEIIGLLPSSPVRLMTLSAFAEEYLRRSSS